MFSQSLYFSCFWIGQREFVRSITTKPANGGKKCPTLSKKEGCNKQKCPVVCILYFPFSIFHYKDIFFRDFTFRTANGKNGDLVSCSSLSLHCSLFLFSCLFWTDGKCSAICDGGYQTRKRGKTGPLYGGKACSGASTSRKECGKTPCWKGLLKKIINNLLILVFEIQFPIVAIWPLFSQK